MHLVAASWLMTSLTASAALVALLQTANAIPSVALALPAGAMAEVFDRRRMIIATQAYQLVVAGLLGVLTLAHAITPALLLALTVALGAGATLGLPAYSAITPELVPREELPAAISLNSITVTASQAVGPALGGLLVASLGAGAVFVINAASFLAVVVVIAGWRCVAPPQTLPPEHVVSAIGTGLRYTANAPELKTVLIRSAAYVIAFSSVAALLAVITRTRLGGTAAAYGILLGLVGLGGVTGALVLPRFRKRLHTDTLVTIASLVHAGVILAVASLRSVAAVCPVMFLAGFAQMTVMSSLNIAAQQALPSWVRGRGLAIYQLVFQLGYAGGAALWGTLATSHGIGLALPVAAGTMAASTLLALRYKLDRADGIDVLPAYRPEPHLPVEVDPDDGPVLIEVEYRVSPDRLAAFTTAGHELRAVRGRAGAMHWALYQDTEHPELQIESFLVASWTEHRRQGERQTVTDQRTLDSVAALRTGPGAPAKRYLLGQHFRRHAQDHGRATTPTASHAPVPTAAS
jgi:predicted MFS family arabinose efflux permease